jgi:hypothetical protein
MRHALVEILDIGINTGSSLKCGTASTASTTTTGSRCRARRTRRVAEHKLAHVKALW